MLKSLYALVTAALVASFFVPFSANAGVAGSVKDQWYEPVTGSGGTVIGIYMDRSQSFKPANDTIVSMDFYLKNIQNNSLVMLNIYTDKAKTNRVGRKGVILTNPPSEGWVTVSFDAPYVSVTPETTYWAHLVCSDSVTQWAYNNGGYARGEFELNPNNDALFRVYTVDSTAGTGGGTTSPPSTPPTSTTEEDSSETTTGTSVNTEEPELKVEISQDLAEPALLSVEVNDTEVDLENNTLKATTTDRVKITGEAIEGDNVVVIIGDETYLASVEDGIFVVELNSLTAGSFDVKAQSQMDDKGSVIVDLFNLEVEVPEPVTSAVTEETTPDYTLPYALVVIAAVVAVGSGVGGYLYWSRKNKKAKITKKEKQ